MPPKFTEQAAQRHAAKSTRVSYHHAKYRKPRYMNKRAPVRDCKIAYRATRMSSRPLKDFHVVVRGITFGGAVTARIPKIARESGEEPGEDITGRFALPANSQGDTTIMATDLTESSDEDKEEKDKEEKEQHGSVREDTSWPSSVILIDHTEKLPV